MHEKQMRMESNILTAHPAINHGGVGYRADGNIEELKYIMNDDIIEYTS